MKRAKRRRDPPLAAWVESAFEKVMAREAQRLILACYEKAFIEVMNEIGQENAKRHPDGLAQFLK